MKNEIFQGFEYESDLTPIRHSVRQLLETQDVPTAPKIFIKPNWVAGKYRQSCSQQDSIWSTITHPSLIGVVLQAIEDVFGTSCTVCVGDNPSIDASFDEILLASNLDFYFAGLQQAPQVIDLRPLVCEDLQWYGQKEKMTRQKGDPLGATQIDLGANSLLSGLNPSLFRGVFDDNSATIWAHSEGRHIYELSASIAESDIYISIPKMKTHHKVGVTLNLKGLVGACYNKDFLVHWRNGYPAIGGDEYPDEETFNFYQTQRIQKRGAWSGNDTIWRMVGDLYVALRRLRQSRPEISVVDGIIGGEGEGPFCPRSKYAGTVIVSDSLVEADLLSAMIMGFEPRQIPYLNHFVSVDEIKFEDMISLVQRHNVFNFEPPSQWSDTLWMRN